MNHGLFSVSHNLHDGGSFGHFIQGGTVLVP